MRCTECLKETAGLSASEMHSAHVLRLFYYLSHLGKSTGSSTFVCWAAVLNLHLRNCLPKCTFSDISADVFTVQIGILRRTFWLVHFLNFEIAYCTIYAIFILCIKCNLFFCIHEIPR